MIRSNSSVRRLPSEANLHDRFLKDQNVRFPRHLYCSLSTGFFLFTLGKIQKRTSRQGDMNIFAWASHYLQELQYETT